MLLSTRAARAPSVSSYSPLAGTRAFGAAPAPANAGAAGYDFDRVSVSAPAAPVNAPIQRGGALSRGASVTPRLARGFSSGRGRRGPMSMEELIRRIQLRQERSEQLANNQRMIQQSGKKTKTLVRFLDKDKPSDYQSPVEKKSGKQALDDTLKAVRKHKDLQTQLRLGHENMKRYDESPYISTTSSHVKAATSGTLDDITSSAPNLSVFKVPSDQVHPALTKHGQNEGENLVEGEGFANMEVHTAPNPYKDGILRLHMLTPELIDALGEENEDERKEDV